MRRNEEGLVRISDVARSITLGLENTLTSTNTVLTVPVCE
jgi:hypothetical protein